MARFPILLLVLTWVVGCSSSPPLGDGGTGGGAANGGGTADGGANAGSGGAANGGGTGDGGGTATDALAAKYPCDNGISADPAVVWAENFEATSLTAVTARYDQVRSMGMSLVTDKPQKSCGARSLSMTSSDSNNATDLFKRFADQDELYVRWYAKYQTGAHWHHSGFWLGGYYPSLSYPFPRAGIKPTGDERVSFALEPVWGSGTANARLDFYNYWQAMRTCSNCGGNYWGNALISRNEFTVDPGWMCLEMHVKLNPNGASATGAELEVWKNDTLVQRFPETGPVGYWVQNYFCPTGANGPECNYSPSASGPVDLRFRTSTALKLNHIWLQNYITATGSGTMWLDDIVVAKSRVGCIR